MEKRIAIALFLIIALAVALRAIPTFNMQFFEPDNFYYFSILQQAHGFALPSTSIYNALPPAERYGLYIPALFFMVLGFTIQNSMYISTAIATILILLLSYIYTEQLFKNKYLALLAVLFLALSPALMSKTMLTEYRGDTFFSIFMLASLILFAKIFQPKKQTIHYALAMGLILLLAVCSWSGGLLATGIMAISMLFLIFTSLSMSKPSEWRLPKMMFIFASICVCFISLQINLFSQASIAIQELQHPTLQYFIVNYGLLGLISPAFIMAFPTTPILIACLIALVCIVVFYKEIINGNYAIFGFIPYLVVMIFINATYTRFDALASIPIAIFSAYAIFWLYAKAKTIMQDLIIKPQHMIAFLTAIFIFLSFIIAYHDMASLQPANSDNASMISTMLYLKGYTPINSTIMSFWPDGSVIEGIANRRVVTDSVAANIYAQPQARWLLAQNLSLKDYPNVSYILSRGIYNNELIGICEEANDTGLMNCTQDIYQNGTLKDNYQNLYQATNVYKLMNACNAIGCNITQNATALQLVYENQTNKVYEVLK